MQHSLLTWRLNILSIFFFYHCNVFFFFLNELLFMSIRLYIIYNDHKSAETQKTKKKLYSFLYNVTYKTIYFYLNQRGI